VPDVSVVICAYTEARWDDLVAAVESVRRQSASPREIIVVIDHNPDLLERVRTQIPDVVVIENKETQGLSGARNSGIAASRGEIIGFLDDDAVAAPDWLEQLCAHCEDSQVLGAGGAVEPMWLHGRPTWLPEEFYWVVGCTYRGLPQMATPVRNPFGGCMCVRREVFEIVGGFRSRVGRESTRPMGCEETELCIRARQRWPSRVFLYEPRAKIYHRVPASRVLWSYFRSRCYAEGLSKALVSRFVGVKDGLASERVHTFRTLPQGIARGLVDIILRRDPMGLVRAGAIMAGLVITTAGYLVGTMASWFGVR
jgi:GT2 family glycosyltransferase